MPEKKTSPAVEALRSLAPAKKGQQQPGFELAQNYLVRFGYLEESQYTANALDEETTTALARFQERFALPVTGDFDEPTREAMTQGRCGLPDVRLSVEFATTCAWTKRNLTFALETGTSDCVGEFTAVRNAFKTWAAVVPLTFTEVATNQAPDMLVDWRPANDPDHSMVGGVLAHADFPPGCSVVTNGFPKPLHFDDSEHNWSIGAVANSFDVETVALHEIGHLLGLAHSNVAGAVMFPSVSSNFTKRALTADDISGVKLLYPHQGDWRWCNKCQGLWFGGHATSGKCSAGGTHDKTGSGNYFPGHNMPTTPNWQNNWRWCNKCEGMWFAGNNTTGKCSAGGGHEKTGSGNYSHMHNFAVAAGQQNGWRWCSKCQGMWFGANPSQSSCPAGGTHIKVGSGNYSIVHRAGAAVVESAAARA